MAMKNDGLSLLELRSRLPDRLFKSSWTHATNILLRDLGMVALFASLAYKGDAFISSYPLDPTQKTVLRAILWLTYWWFQGLVFTGIWVLGHECGHGSFFPSRTLDDIVGFMCHTALWTPYFSWKYTHQSHHRHHGSMEKDEHWVPRTRSELNVPEKPPAHDFFEDTPIITVLRLIVQQILGLPAYLILNLSGPVNLPAGTSHFNPYAVLFKPSQRKHVFISDVGVLAMGYLVYLVTARLGSSTVMKYYGIPCIAVSHWVTMIVFLQHTDPELPRYRKKAWNFKMGALSTMDRDFLGWQGQFFLHNVSHFHTIHHLFPSIPFYHTEEATDILKAELSEEYHSTSKSVFQSLYDNFRNCYFVEDEGDIVFYKDRHGRNPILDTNDELVMGS
ncbi:hypothetical protein CPC08DRAFT_727660 [Agrocybe pediades]|nr:hypothetical protein CPC08DRAFT_727660 [Agrocybe pediades]